MWERMFDLVLGLKKEHRLMMVITLIYAVTLFGITVDHTYFMYCLYYTA